MNNVGSKVFKKSLSNILSKINWIVKISHVSLFLHIIHNEVVETIVGVLLEKKKKRANKRNVWQN